MGHDAACRRDLAAVPTGDCLLTLPDGPCGVQATSGRPVGPGQAHSGPLSRFQSAAAPSTPTTNRPSRRARQRRSKSSSSSGGGGHVIGHNPENGAATLRTSSSKASP